MRGLLNFSVLLSFAVGSGFASAQSLVVPEPNAAISPFRERAALIHRRLTGVKIGIDAQILKDMEALLVANKPLEAAALVTGTNQTNGETNFYDTTLRQLATRMSTREETVKAPMSDFVATFIGVVRDEKDARELLTGRYYYAGKTTAVPVKAGGTFPITGQAIDDIVKTNNHYEILATTAGSLRDKIDLTSRPQEIINNTGTGTTPNPDSAGLITTRAFTQAHAAAGTNRRMVHFSFKQFLCVDMQGWATADAPDNHIGPDVDRAPGGDPGVFLNTCKTCHGNMDGMRTAFANIDFSNGVLKNGLILKNTAQNYNNTNLDLGANTFASVTFTLAGSPTVTAPGVSAKYIRNADVTRTGFFATDATWVNTATAGANASYFGWRSPRDANGNISGFGVNQFGTMVANSEAFSRCMVKQVYQQICKRQVSQGEVNYVRNVASEFEKEGYKLRKVFQRIATSTECIGN